MKKKRYPPEMFRVGLLISLVHTFYVPVVALILLLLHFVLPQYIPAPAALVVFLLWPVYALIDQLKIRREVMSNDNYDFITDPDNADTWQEELRRQAKEKINAGLGPITYEDDGQDEDEDQDQNSEES